MKKPIINKQDRYLIIQFPDILKSKLLLLRIAKLKFYRVLEKTPTVKKIQIKATFIISSFKLAKALNNCIDQMTILNFQSKNRCEHFPCDDNFDCPYPMESGEPECK